MREFLEDAEKHRDDGYGRARKHAQRELPRRFYKEVGIGTVRGQYAVTLDGKSPRTPGQKPVVVPSAQLAKEMAREWAGQGEFVDPATMPLVRLVNTALEAGEERMPALREEIVRYAGNDLLLYRADTPRELVAEQERVWDGVLVALARHLGAGFQPTIGVVHQPQPQVTLARVAELLADEPLLPLTALVSITGLTGSGLLAIALRHNLLGAEEAWVAAHVDEDYNIRLWGEVSEAATRRAERRSEYDAAVALLTMLPRP